MVSAKPLSKLAPAQKYPITEGAPFAAVTVMNEAAILVVADEAAPLLGCQADIKKFLLWFRLWLRHRRCWRRASGLVLKCEAELAGRFWARHRHAWLQPGCGQLC